MNQARNEAVRLTEQVSCAGCAAKLSPLDLRDVLSALPAAPRSKGVLVGPETWDDAGVFRISATRALVQTVDFFTPMVNDPFDFGRIAAANALSDVYAMGGTPMTALSIVCYPESGDMKVLGEILRGGAELLKQARVALMGGHSVRDKEMKFGFAVTGEVHPKRIISNAGAASGDMLVLTKPLGVGILATALKQRLLTEATIRLMTTQMATLNRAAGEAMQAVGVSAATDVTGFGLLGHALNVARASRKTIRIWSAAVPVLPGVLEFAARGVAPGGLMTNAAYTTPDVTFDAGVPEPLRKVLVDPQTSGGLLIAVRPSRATALMRRLTRGRVSATVVGEVLPRRTRWLEVAA
ncbi:MAG: selenide, water dikinase SelD [Candidatus Eisenbacteria bacterium]|uniref:Selenide, water dikinase n=1 Tax=Eiseniibacteriota bacterium TaxID=2212470 RepID=A0A538T9Y7_UNCEI|nr:MAG: selenide, water dikinase SelD [Candidatus Eisenbacteria bacterium]